MNDTPTTHRTVFEISGEDRHKFLQGLISNDVAKARDGLVYAALLTPQGKYLADFFVFERGDALYVDVADALAQGLLTRLNMYKLRSDVTISPTALTCSRGVGDRPDDAFDDPRHPSLGWRRYHDGPAVVDSTDWDAVRVAAVIPTTGIELIPNQSYPLEAGLDRLNGVDFRKGCYVGQEVTARMKHKTSLRKGLARVDVQGVAPVGSDILADGKVVGTLFTQADGQAIAYLRFDRAKGTMVAGDATVSLPD